MKLAEKYGIHHQQKTKKKKSWEKIPELLRQEEQDSEMNYPKSDNDFEGDNEITLTDTTNIDDNNTKKNITSIHLKIWNIMLS